MFVHSQANPIKNLPLRTKIFLGILFLTVLALIFVFGFAALIIALVGGVLTFVATLFGRKPSREVGSSNSPFGKGPTQGGKVKITFQQQTRTRPRRSDNDDVIDI